MKGELLPIGTVVKIEGGSKNVMICGYYAQGDEDSKIYTYLGCIYPEGFMENLYCLFDAPQIEDVLYRGLENEESKKFNHMVSSEIGIDNSPIKHMEGDSGSSIAKMSGRRTPKPPKHPRSKSEMLSRYGIKKISGEGEVRR